MKKALENILSSIASLNDKQVKFIITQLKVISDKYNSVISQNDSLKRQLTGVTPQQYNDTLFKAIEVLRIFGFNENTLIGLNSDFLVWFFKNTVTNAKFNPKLMNFYLLNSLQQAFFIAYAENDGIVPNYNQVKKIMLTFDDTITEYENEFKLSLTELINKLDGGEN